ncbi:MAG: Kdo hydroxylase family protein [Acidobacteriota bacterium]|nr:Kdo hydroxylase family protein [Acidobacteriota bacterium]
MEAIQVDRSSGDPQFAVKALERGNILFFPATPFRISEPHRALLLNTGQADGNFHKNISYKPHSGKLSGLGKANPGEEEGVRDALHAYSEAAIGFLEEIVSPYRAGWQTDYASFRSIEEEGRDLPLKKRNDLLHTDAFPTRPTNGGLILRIFTNINPSKDRVWVTSDPFSVVAGQYAERAGVRRIADGARSPVRRIQRAATRAAHALGVPVAVRSPYDEFMLGFHDFLKSNTEYQRDCVKYRFSFPPNSTWIVFTDVVPHSVLAGRYALEQTMIIARKTLLQPECAPASVLETLIGQALTD